MIDRKFIGHLFPSHTTEVEKGRLRFFAKAIGETNPIYIEESAAKDAGYRSIPAPPTYLFCLEMLDVADPFEEYEKMGIELGKILHGEQTFHYYQPVCAGDTLTLYVNGVQLASVMDTQLVSGDIGFIASTYEAAPIEVRFDNLLVLEPAAFSRPTEESEEG